MAVLEAVDHGRVRVLRLNRPEKKNALSSELGWAIVAALQEAARDESVWVVGITGAGDAFCSGLDLAPEPDAEDHAPFSGVDAQLDELGWVGRFPLLMREQCDKPVVAGVNGVAVGAGLSLAMAADLRVASDRARFLAGYARAGTSTDGGLSWTLTQALGTERALRFLLEGRMLGADEALALGLVGEVVPAADFDAAFLARCRALAEIAPIAARQTKRVVMRAALASDLEAFARDELALARRGLASEDSAEARRALMERRKPRFQGR